MLLDRLGPIRNLWLDPREAAEPERSRLVGVELCLEGIERGREELGARPIPIRPRGHGYTAPSPEWGGRGVPARTDEVPTMAPA